MMGVMKRIILTAEEQDVHTGWRKLYCYTQRAGVTARAKRRTSQRERRQARRWIMEQLEDLVE